MKRRKPPMANLPRVRSDHVGPEEIAAMKDVAAAYGADPISDDAARQMARSARLVDHQLARFQ